MVIAGFIKLICYFDFEFAFNFLLPIIWVSNVKGCVFELCWSCLIFVFGGLYRACSLSDI